MLEFFKRLFGARSAETPAVPYKVEKPAAQVGEFPFPSAKPAKSETKPAAKKPTAKKPTARKPRKPAAPKV